MFNYQIREADIQLTSYTAPFFNKNLVSPEKFHPEMLSRLSLLRIIRIRWPHKRLNTWIKLRFTATYCHRTLTY